MPLFHVRGVPIGGIAIMLALVASMGGFIFGYDTGQISDILLMDDFKRRFAQCNSDNPSQCEFSTVREGLIVGLLSIGTLVGALAGAPTADAIGRKKAMIVECAVFVLGVVIQLAAFSSWQQFAIGRLVSGLGVGGLSAAVPMYQAETAPPQIRGTLTATYQLFITFGILTAYCISIGAREIPGSGQWRTVVAIGIVWALVLAIGMIFMPESPRWLAAKNRLEDARTALARARGLPQDEAHTTPYIINEVEQIRSHAEQEKRMQSGWLACFAGRGMVRYRTLLCMALQAFQQLTGANYFFYYGATIFQSVGLEDSFITQIILGAVNFVCTFGGLWVLERFGRRWPLIIGGLWQSAWLFVFAAAGTSSPPPDGPSDSMGKLMIVAACLFILGYASTWGPGIWILIGETFPTRTRAKQGALATSTNWLFNFLLAFFTPFIVSAIDFRYGFVFAACNMAGAVIVYFFLYESSDLTLESVDDMYNDPSCKPWTSRSWAPQGFSSRDDYARVKGEERQEKGVGLKPPFDRAARDSSFSGEGTMVEGHNGKEKDVPEHREAV